MNLADLCEPLFQYICFLNRTHRKGGQLDFQEVRSAVQELREAMRSQAASDPRLADQYRRVELPLVFFVDSMVAQAGWSISELWHQQRLAFDPAINELAGDEKYFILLDEELADSSPAATERLLVYYTCLGMGFTGWLEGRPKELQKKMDEVAVRIRGFFHTDPQRRLCPESYQHVDTRNLIEPPSRRLGGLAIAVGGLAVVLFIINLSMYNVAFKDLSRILGAIEDFGARALAATPEPAAPKGK